MNWHELTVIAAYAPRAAGVAIGLPFVRANAGGIFALRDVTSDAPEPNTLIKPGELEALLVGRLVRVPSMPARQGYLTVVASRRLLRSLRLAQVPDDSGWQDLSNGMCLRYALASQVEKWRRDSSNALILATTRALQNYYRSSDHLALQHVEETLRQLLYLTDRTSSTRRDMFVLYAIVLTLTDRNRLPAVEELAIRDLRISREDFHAEVTHRTTTFTTEGMRPTATVFGEKDLTATKQPIWTLSYGGLAQGH